MAALRFLLVLGLAALAAPQVRAADRAAELAKLLADYEAAEAEYIERELPPNPTPAERIARYKANFLWTFFPKFLALAEAEPLDDVAKDACKWLVTGHGLYPNWQPLYDADQKAWRILQRQQLTEEDIRELCGLATWRQSPASEAFLRDMASRTDLPGQAHAFAMVALAEFLSTRVDGIEAGGLKAAWPPPKQPQEYVEFLETQLAKQWLEFDAATDAAPLRAESIALFRRVREEYGDVPVTDSASHDTLGQKAEHFLYALEHLVIGAPAPPIEGVDLDGTPLRLSDYRGKTVLLSFWGPGCQPCIAALPEEKELLERFRDQPFALLGVCGTTDVAASKQVAAEHGMTWPSWLDESPGTIDKKYNVDGIPRFYLLDADGRIVSKDVPRGKLAAAVEAALRQQSVDAQ
jgi:peroxiredoxin